MVDSISKIGYNKNVEIKKAVTLRGFFISTSLTSYRPFCQPNIFGARVPAITLHAGIPHVSLFLISTIRKSSVVAGIFSSLQNEQVALSADTLKTTLTTKRRGTSSMADDYLNIPLGNGQTDPSSESNPDSQPTLTEQIAATQAEVDAIGEFISVAMGMMAAKIDLLERLQEMAKLGPFYEFIAGMEA